MKLLGVTDDQLSVDELVQHLQLTEPYLDAIILREKSKTDDQLKEVVCLLAEAKFPLRKLIMHANPHLACELSIKYVQLTGYGMSVRDAHSHFPSLHFGSSVHSLKEAEKAQQDGADWLVYGHVFETASKPGLPARGTEELFSIAERCAVPVYAIGGIEPHHLPNLQRNNVAGAAVLSPMRSVESLENYRNVLEKGEVANGENN